MTVGSGKTWRVRVVRRRLIASAIAVGSGEAAAQDKLKVAAVFETPIEEPWVNQIHVALLQAKEESRHRVHLVGERVRERFRPRRCASTPSRATA